MITSANVPRGAWRPFTKMVHEMKLSPFTFEMESVEMETDKVAAHNAAEGRRLMELFRVNGVRGLDEDRLTKFVRRNREDKLDG